MNAEPAVQLRLLDLQALDARLDQIEHKRRSLPQLATIADALPDPREVMTSLVERGKRLVVCTLGADGAIAIDSIPACTQLHENGFAVLRAPGDDLGKSFFLKVGGELLRIELDQGRKRVDGGNQFVHYTCPKCVFQHTTRLGPKPPSLTH